MMISTRGRYALRVMLDLAEHADGRYVPMKEIAERQGISAGYMEKIMPVLTESGLLDGIPGKGGGYRLKRPPEDYRVGEVLRLVEGDLAPVACLAAGAPACPRAARCPTLPMWRGYAALTARYFDGIRLSDLLHGGPGLTFGENCAMM